MRLASAASAAPPSSRAITTSKTAMSGKNTPRRETRVCPRPRSGQRRAILARSSRWRRQGHDYVLTMLPKRKLGSQGLEVSAIGLGLMSMSMSYGLAEERDEKESIATIHRAIELGCIFLDTAEVYGPYTNEELLGKALKQKPGSREKVVIATKFGFRIASAAPTNYAPSTGLDSTPANIRRAIEGSLERIGTDYIDLYYQHR